MTDKIKEGLELNLAKAKEAMQFALKTAKKMGATGVECSIGYERGLDVSSRMAEVETVEFNEGGSLGICVFKGQHKGNVSTTDLSAPAVEAAVKKAVEIARYTEADPFAGMADADLMAHDYPELALYAPADQSVTHATEQVLRCERAMLEADTRIVNSDGANYASHCGFRLYGNSHGFIGHYLRSRNSLSAMPIAQDGERMERDYAYTVARREVDLKSPEAVAAEAVENTLARLGGRRLPTQTAPVIFHSSVAQGLFGHFVGAIAGRNQYKKTSFLLDSLGEQVLPEWLSIYEDPFILGGLASSPFDREGVAPKAQFIVSNGCLNTYLLNSYAARRLGLKSTGHAGGIHNWFIQTAAEQGPPQDLTMLCKTMGRGLLVTELMGQGVNGVTGDYSRGAGGFWVEQGEIQFPVTEITIAGNLKTMYQQIVAVGSDIDTRHGVQSGSILIENMKIAGE